MREILFRGKRIDNGEWIEGGYRAEKVGDYITAVSIMEHLGHGAWNVFRVDPSTVGQYTGICDKNGKKIFEGDIVRHHNDSPYFTTEKEEKGVVFWDDQYCGWRRTSNGEFHGGVVKDYRMSKTCDYEIIGNIHDNPELLEVSHE